MIITSHYTIKIQNIIMIRACAQHHHIMILKSSNDALKTTIVLFECIKILTITLIKHEIFILIVTIIIVIIILI